MREIRLSGSEGGGALTGSPYPYPSMIVVGHFLASAQDRWQGREERQGASHHGRPAGGEMPSPANSTSRW